MRKKKKLKGKKIEDMSIEELEQVRKDRFREAIADGTLSRIHFVVNEFGCRVEEHGEVKFKWNQGDITICCDYHDRMTVHVGDKLVCNKDGSVPAGGKPGPEEFIIPGDWINKILVHTDRAVVRHQAEQHSEEQRRKQELLDKLRSEREGTERRRREPGHEER